MQALVTIHLAFTHVARCSTAQQARDTQGPANVVDMVRFGAEEELEGNNVAGNVSCVELLKQVEAKCNGSSSLLKDAIKKVIHLAASKHDAVRTWLALLW